MCPSFFFQAEDGIRDGHVTGVQTCALPICSEGAAWADRAHQHAVGLVEVGCAGRRGVRADRLRRDDRSEERRVGKVWILSLVPYRVKPGFRTVWPLGNEDVLRIQLDVLYSG